MSDLVVIEQQNVMAVFTTEKAIDPILEKISKEAKSIVADVSTDKGRKEIASVAYKVAQAKSYLDGLGKTLVDDLKEVPKKVDANRKIVRDYLDALKEEVRKPLTDWENEQLRIEAEKAELKAKEQAEAIAALEAEKLAKQLETDHELALFMDAEFNRNKKEEAERKEKERIAYEAKIALDAENRVKAELEAKQKAESEAAQRKIVEQQLAIEKAERERIESENRAKFLAEQAEIAKQKAVEDEKLRVKLIAENEAKELAKREADKNHKKEVHGFIIKSLAEFAELNEEQSKKVITAIAKQLIPNVTINY